MKKKDKKKLMDTILKEAAVIEKASEEKRENVTITIGEAHPDDDQVMQHIIDSYAQSESIVHPEIKDYYGDNDDCESIEVDDAPCYTISNGSGRRLKNSRKEDEMKEESKGGPKQWSVNGDIYRAVADTQPKMEAGYYTFNVSQELGFYFEKKKVNLNKLFYLPNTASEIMMKDISDFWTLKEQYEKYQRVFKRNYLLYSAPGTGKTSIINLMCKDLIEKYNGLVFLVNSGEELAWSQTGIELINKVEPDRKMIMIIEDIDNYISCNGRGSFDGYLLNLLDGNVKVPNLVVIATTNYIEQLESRYTNRPSRFDRVLEYPLPNEISRKIFIENTILPEDIKKINIDKWVALTKGYTIDHINEVIVLHFIHGYSEDESFASVDKMVKKNDNLKNVDSIDKSKTTIGFEGTFGTSCEKGLGTIIGG